MAKKRINRHMPVSKAKNAYQLLGEIHKLILEEPKRYNQTAWIRRGKPGPKTPGCGTVGCVAGWVCALKVTRPVSKSYEAKNFVADVAADVLGLDGLQVGVLFDGTAADTEFESKPQTKQHAKTGAAHIKRFMEKHADQLKAKAV